jgi:hypothetical protein
MGCPPVLLFVAPTLILKSCTIEATKNSNPSRLGAIVEPTRVQNP